MNPFLLFCPHHHDHRTSQRGFVKIKAIIWPEKIFTKSHIRMMVLSKHVMKRLPSLNDIRNRFWAFDESSHFASIPSAAQWHRGGKEKEIICEWKEFSSWWWWCSKVLEVAIIFQLLLWIFHINVELNFDGSFHFSLSKFCVRVRTIKLIASILINSNSFLCRFLLVWVREGNFYNTHNFIWCWGKGWNYDNERLSWMKLARWRRILEYWRGVWKFWLSFWVVCDIKW